MLTEYESCENLKQHKFMSQARCHQCGCPTPEVVEIPGVPGTNGTNFANVLPGAGSPEGVVIATPGTTYLNITDASFWIKATGLGSNGWICLIGATA